MTPEEIAQAVDTARREGFERGASPSVQVLLAEVSKTEGGREGMPDYAQGVQDGLVHAVQTLIRADAARYEEAWKAGWKAGRESVVVPPQATGRGAAGS
jgi:hypothetical protein